MTKYLSTTKLISLLPELNLTELYDRIKNTRPSASYFENGIRVFEYLYHDSETIRNYIQYVYHEETKTMGIRFIRNPTEYNQRFIRNPTEDNQRQNINMHPKTQWLVTFKSPEFDIAYMLGNGLSGCVRNQCIIYIVLINYALHKLNATTSTMKSIINSASIELDDPNDVFNIQDSEIKESKRQGDYLYLNGLDNGVLFNRIPNIIEHIDDDQNQLYLLNYTASLVTRLSFADLAELARLLNTANRKIQHAYEYYIGRKAKDYYQTYLTTIIAKIQERRNELMTTQVQRVPLSIWKKDNKIRESIDQGAKVQVVLPMSFTKN